LVVRFANQIFLDGGGVKYGEYLSWGFDRAAKELELSYARHALDFSYPMALGNIYLRWGALEKNLAFYQKAVEYYRQALVISPQRQAVMFQLATAYLLSGETEKAVSVSREAVSYDKEAADARWRLAMVYLSAGRKAEAYTELKESQRLEFFGTIVEEMQKAAALCLENKDYNCLAGEYSAWTGKDPQNAELYAELAMAYALAGKMEEAKAAAERVAEIDPKLRAQVENFLRQLGY
jgi:tetratricopeptide (TPR) repeat protein